MSKIRNIAQMRSEIRNSKMDRIYFRFSNIDSLPNKKALLHSSAFLFGGVEGI